MTKIWEVYVAHDHVREKIYVGQTSQGLKKRIACHASNSRKLSSLMAKHVVEHGVGAFTWSVVGEHQTRDSAIRDEAAITDWYIKTLGRKHVLNDGCGDSPGPSRISAHLGARRSAETRKKISMARKGKPGYKGKKTYTEAGMQRLIESRTGRKPTTETKAKLSASKVGNVNRRDKTIYRFTHKTFGDLTCSQYELCVLAMVDKSHILRVVTGKCAHAKGWMLREGGLA